MTMAKKSFLEKISDITKIHHRAAFSTVDKHIANLNLETRFAEMVSRRFSCRSFSDREIIPAKINKILKTARIAPSAENRQPIHVWAVTSAEALARLREVNPAFGAPAVFVVGAQREKAWVRPCDQKSSAETDAAVACMHIVLEASDLGLGTVWISDFDPTVMAEKFPETAGYEVMALMAVGYPSQDEDADDTAWEFKSFEEFATVL